MELFLGLVFLSMFISRLAKYWSGEDDQKKAQRRKTQIGARAGSAIASLFLKR